MGVFKNRVSQDFLASAVLNLRLHYHNDTYLSTWVVNSYDTRVLSAYHSTTRTLLTGRTVCQTFLLAHWLVNNDVMWPREVPHSHILLQIISLR